MKKKRDMEKPELSPLQLKMNELEKKGAVVALIIGFDEKSRMLIDSNLNTYEELHAALNRATVEVTMSHIKFVNENANKVDNEGSE